MEIINCFKSIAVDRCGFKSIRIKEILIFFLTDLKEKEEKGITGEGNVNI